VKLKVELINLSLTGSFKIFFDDKSLCGF
jgi:hypothetical protein